jgi:hypothetical protein
MPREKGQVAIKNIKEVQEFNDALDKSQELMASLGEAGEELYNSLIDVHLQTSENNKASGKQVDLSKNQSKVGKAILDVIKNQNEGNKLGTILAKTRLNFLKMTSDKSDDMTQSLFEQYDVQQKQTKEQQKQDNLTGQIADGLKNQIPMYKEITMLFNKKTRLAGMLLLTIGMTTKILKGFAARTKIIGQEFGALGMMNDDFKTGILGASTNAKRLGMDVKDVADVVKELTTNFGVGRDEAVDLSNKILDTSMALGISVSETTKLVGALTQIAGLSFETANNFSKQVGLLAQAEGAAPNAILKDLANSAEVIAKFTGATPDNLAKAAIQANKLGLQLKDIAGTAEGLLNFQDSLNKEIEASILLGRNVNLQKARELALSGDMEGLAIEITKQVGSQAEFEKMNVFQRKALAASLGMNEQQLAKIVSNQDKVASLGDKIAQQKSFEELVGREGLDNISKIVNDFKTIGANLVNTIGPAISFIAGGIAKFTSFLSQSPLLIKSITAALSILAAKSIMSAIGAIFTGLGTLGLIGIPLAMGAIAMMKTEVSSAKKVGDLFMGGQGPILTTPQGQQFEGSVRDEVLMAPGISNMVNNGGGMSKQDMEQAVAGGVRGLVDENRRIREQNAQLITATQRQASQLGEIIGDMA